MNKAFFMMPLVGEPAGMAAGAARLGPWFHNVHLPDGSQTAPEHPLGDFPTCMWNQIKAHLPDHMEGMTVLDVGCNSGFYSIELARRGASVTAVEMERHFLDQAGWAARQFGVSDRIRFVHASVYEIGRWRAIFDYVLFMGVFYHLRHPLLGLDILAEKTKQLMVFQTLTLPAPASERVPADVAYQDREVFSRPGWPKMAFVENSLAGDPTNGWLANDACVVAMLNSSGLTVKGRPGHEIYLCAPGGESCEELLARNRDELLTATGGPREEDPVDA